jgi:[ribosomal protein S5]-alanine N-acetyltransferase
MNCFLTSKRIGFRKWTLEDLNLAKELWGNYEVTKFIYAAGVMPEDKILERLQKEIETETSHGIQYWPIFLLSDDEFVGCCGLRPYNRDKMIHEVGVHIHPRHWRKGFASEAMERVMKYAFDELKVNALFAGHNPKNDASRAMLLKIGFRFTHDELYAPTGLNHPSYLMTAEEYSLKK